MRVMDALMAERLAAELDPRELGGIANEAMARRLGLTKEQVGEAVQGLIDLNFISQGLPIREADESGYRQVQCDFQWPDGQYCNTTVQYYTLTSTPSQHGGQDSLSGFCSLEHANAVGRPTLATAQKMVAAAWRTANSAKGCPCGHCNPVFDFILLKKLVEVYPDPITVEAAHTNIMPVPDHICADARKVLDGLYRAYFAELDLTPAELAHRLRMSEERVREHTETLIEAGLWSDDEEDDR